MKNIARINLERRTGLTVTIEGPQGSGKTRIADLIEGFARANDISLVIVEKQI